MSAKILIVDDSNLARRLNRQFVEELGFTGEEAHDGAEALERYFLGRHDLVLLDLVMNGMHGLEVLAKLREINPDVRVIVATADIQQSTRDQVHAAGAVGLINKPFNREILAKAVSSTLAGVAVWN